tara:strand:+ start:2479 stop:3033 length:555 start_codon:yes stop_codon:yes gene_type:complete
MTTNSKPPATSSAVASYLKDVKDRMDPASQAATDFLSKPEDKRGSVKELMSRMSTAETKAVTEVDPRFFDDVMSMDDAAIKAATSGLPSYVSKKIRAIAADINKETAQLAQESKTRRSRGMGLMEAKRKAFGEQMTRQKQPQNPATVLALAIRNILSDKRRAQAAFPQEVEAPIAPDTTSIQRT